jgi:RecG-like helicase
MRIRNLPVNSLSCLVFRVVYKVKYVSRGCAEQTRDFVFGRKAFFPNFDLKYPTGIHDREVSLQLSMCHELSIINDYLWDVNEGDLHATDLLIKVRMQLSNIAKLPTLEEQSKMREEIIKNEHAKTETRSLLAKAGAGGKRGAPPEIDQLTRERIAELQFQLTQAQDDNERLQKRMREQARLAKMAA